MVYITESSNMENMGDRTAVPDNDFIKEVKTQTEIYNLTNTFLQPITPSIFDSFIINKNDIFIDMLKNITLDNLGINLLNGIQGLPITRIGFILMELAEGYQSLGDYWSGSNNLPRDKMWSIGMLGDVLERLHRQGYIHGDLHFNNILINPNEYLYYMDEKIEKYKGNLMLIDFGFSQKINEIKNTQILESLQYEKQKENLPSYLGYTELLASPNPQGEAWITTLYNRDWNEPKTKEYFNRFQEYRMIDKKYKISHNLTMERMVKEKQIYYYFNGDVEHLDFIYLSPIIIGDNVIITNIKTKPELNGKIGKIIKIDNGRYNIQFDNGDIKSILGDNIEKIFFLPGDRVLVKEVKNFQNYNGIVGICSGFNIDNKRYNIKFDDGKTFAFRPHNLQLFNQA